VAETCGKENPAQLISGCKAHPDNASDAGILSERAERLAEDGCLDGGFYSLENPEKAEILGIDTRCANMTALIPEMDSTRLASK
jgi:hypothetical protein